MFKLSSDFNQNKIKQNNNKKTQDYNKFCSKWFDYIVFNQSGFNYR